MGHICSISSKHCSDCTRNLPEHLRAFVDIRKMQGRDFYSSRRWVGTGYGKLLVLHDILDMFSFLRAVHSTTT